MRSAACVIFTIPFADAVQLKFLLTAVDGLKLTFTVAVFPTFTTTDFGLNVSFFRILFCASVAAFRITLSAAVLPVPVEPETFVSLIPVTALSAFFLSVCSFFRLESLMLF